MRKRVSQSHSNFSTLYFNLFLCHFVSQLMTTIVFSRKSSPTQGKEDPRNVLSPLLPTLQQASSAVVNWRNLPKIRLAYQDYVAKYCWYVYEQCNNSNYKAKYTTSSNWRQNFMKIGWITARHGVWTMLKTRLAYQNCVEKYSCCLWTLQRN